MKPKKRKNTPQKVRKQVEAIRPVYPSMIAASVHLGIPKPTLKFASKSGCPAFDDHHRVNALLLIRWLFAQDESSREIDWGKKLEEYQAQREKVKLDKDLEVTADKDEITDCVNTAILTFFNSLDRKFKLELPPALKGLDEMAIAKLLTETCEQFKDLLRSSFQKLAADAPVKKDPAK